VGAGARLALGIEPSLFYCAQFAALRRIYQPKEAVTLPLTSQELTTNSAHFGVVLSMGVLYPRRSPLDHLAQLRSFIREDGELILETLVIDGPRGMTLLPHDRYAGMRNVFFLPSVLTLVSWLERIGFQKIEVGDVVPTEATEQRRTPWMQKPSLADFLDAQDLRKTIEGYPAPRRVMIKAAL
ncbi:MAG: tRNA 5-methoxyuridine(34)/uridine 5-oxyacetic acid(34) synthase CmoB, partial [Polyangiaceae bacterium]|nr:tRNA 5-methoxyuridine(34)/uridine 5-oxyacetic acid(34) synthase CmoB [Polyangiaceae bacterium]